MDLQVVGSGTAAGNIAMIKKQLRSINVKTWDDLAKAKQQPGISICHEVWVSESWAGNDNYEIMKDTFEVGVSVHYSLTIHKTNNTVLLSVNSMLIMRPGCY